MYLSRLFLNLRSREVQRDLRDCQQLHRTVMSAFPDVQGSASARADLGVLYRLDPHPRTGDLVLLVQSAVAPDWGRLPARYLGRDLEPPKCLDDIYDSIPAGAVFAFRLRANATKRERLQHKRVDLFREQDQLAWLERKALAHGFRTLRSRASSGVPNARALSGARVTGCRPDVSDPERRTMTFGSVLFEGVLRVTDKALFRQALERGIGPGKAYGFGLLTIAPLGRTA